MRKVLNLLISVFLIFNLAACTSNESSQDLSDEKAVYTAGTYKGIGDGRNGEIEVAVTVSDFEIESIQIVSHSETSGISDPALEKMPQRILEAQSLAVDAVSGATMTSDGILAAVENALAEAGADLELLKNKTEKEVEKEKIELECDIVVVGAGGAGLAAAAGAMEKGASVIVLEKLEQTGGSTKLSGGAIIAGGTIYQQAIGFNDTPEAVSKYWIEDEARDSLIESEFPNKDRIYELNDELITTVEWIGETVGLEYAVPRQFGWGGENRAHVAAASPIPASGRGSSGGGVFLIEALEKYLGDSVTIMTGTKGETILMENGKAVGVLASSDTAEYTIHADSVIIATGGFAHSPEMLQEMVDASYYKYADLSSASVGATGDGIRMVMEVGGVPYDEAWVIGAGFSAVTASATKLLSSSNGYRDSIYVNENGERFVREDVAYLAGAIGYAEIAWQIISTEDAERLAALDEVVNQADVVKGETIEELATAMGADPATLAKTIENYNVYCEKGVDEQFGKNADYLVAYDEGPFYALQVVPVTLGTLGGVKTNNLFQVTNEKDEVIEGLYAVGECSNKIYYNQVYIAGSGLGVALTSGRIAGATAASDLEK